MVELFTQIFNQVFVLNFYQFLHFATSQRIFGQLFKHFRNISFCDSCINCSYYPHYIHKSHFGRQFTFQLVILIFSTNNFINNFLFQLIETFTKHTTKGFLKIFLFYTSHMIPSKACLTLNHIISILAMALTYTVRCKLMLCA